MVASLIKELKERKNFIGQEEVKTIYFGGGTPSVLSAGNISEILKEVYAQYTVNDNAEITFECNPDDLSKEYLKGLKECGVNRLSIGIQSLKDFIEQVASPKQLTEYSFTKYRKKKYFQFVLK